MKLTESMLRKIVKEELGKTLKRKNTARMMKEALRRPLPPDADTLLINQEQVDSEYDDDGGMDYSDEFNASLEAGPSTGILYYVGTQDAVEGKAAGEKTNVTAIPLIGTASQWDRFDNGEGLHPVALWLKKNPQIKFIYDEDFAFESVPVGEWIEANAEP